MLNKISFSTIFSSLTLLITLTSVISLQKQHYQQLKSDLSTDNYIQEEKKLKVMLDVQKQMPSFGFKNLVADWTFLNFIQYYGDETAREETGYSLTTEYFETIAEQDPRFIQAYFVLSTANSLFAGKPDRTVALMQEVIDSISPDIAPKSYLVKQDANYLWNYKGVDEILFMGDLKAARHSYEMAEKWSKYREDETGNYMAEVASRTAHFLATTKRDVKHASIGAWLSILSNASDDKTRDYALDRLKALGVIFNITDEGTVEVILPEKDT
ncbi:MAG: hypothetical protein QNJ54_03640 [Prochloraceae cyanobacterium]|nr:hypothetical protein [Prochloraceae cyanobacterium]